MGLLPPTASVSGRVLFDGVNVLERGEESVARHRWKDIAMVFQGAMNAFDPVKRIGEQIVEPMELHGHMSGSEAESRVRGLLETVGIAPERARSYPHELSGGMRQRAAIAMALACSPKVLLADEPTTALDVMVQAQVLQLLTYLSDELGLALVFVTHDLPIVAQTCTHAARHVRRPDRRAGADRGALPRDAAPVHAHALGRDSRSGRARRRHLDPGVPPRLDAELHGCPFAPRCDMAASRCVSERPELRSVGTAISAPATFASSVGAAA
jgi:ABC-type dipeptide/oligopeptide/nickel transport system ATPase component